MNLALNLTEWFGVWDRPEQPDMPFLRAIKGMGYDGVELRMGATGLRWSAEYGRMLAGEGLTAIPAETVVWADACSAVVPPKRPIIFDRLCRVFDCATILGAEVVTLAWDQSRQPRTEEEWHSLVLHQRELADQTPLRLAIKPFCGRESSELDTVAGAVRLVRDVARPNYGYAFDTLCAQRDGIDPTVVLAQSMPELGHVYLSIDHSRTPGSGHARVLDTLFSLRSAGYSRWITVRACGASPPDMAGLHRVLPKAIAWESHLALDAIRTIRHVWNS